MCMAEHDTFQRLGVETQVTVSGVGFHAFALVHTTIEENRVTVVGRDKVLAARYFFSSTEECEFHGGKIWIASAKLQKKKHFSKFLKEKNCRISIFSVGKCFFGIRQAECL